MVIMVLLSNCGTYSPHWYLHGWAGAPPRVPSSPEGGDPSLACTLLDASLQTPEPQTQSSDETWSSAFGLFCSCWRKKTTLSSSCSQQKINTSKHHQQEKWCSTNALGLAINRVIDGIINRIIDSKKTHLWQPWTTVMLEISILDRSPLSTGNFDFNFFPTDKKGISMLGKKTQNGCVMFWSCSCHQQEQNSSKSKIMTHPTHTHTTVYRAYSAVNKVSLRQ